jgi:hypothetical protein
MRLTAPLTACALCALTLAPALAAQDTASTTTGLARPLRVPPTSAQIAAATAAAPADLRARATVLGYSSDGRGTTLRAGAGELVCMASDPAATTFEVACFAKSLQPFMLRERSLRALGMNATAVDSVRNQDVEGGRLTMPRQAAALYTLTAPAGSMDPRTGEVTGARPHYFVYIAGATVQSTGLSTTPEGDRPWIMYPGTPMAHIMFERDMPPAP